VGTKTMGTARKIAAAIAGVAGTGLLVAACSSSSSSSSTAPLAGSTSSSAPASASGSPAAAGTAVLKTEHSSLGTVLANGQGLTVYLFAADHGMTSACTGACATIWPPVTGTPQAAAGVSLTGKLGTITRAGGVKQATYNGHPLYTFKQDSAPGQVHGNGVNGFGAYWYAIKTGGSGASTAPTTGGGGGY
jgi:predicted lipoprotein with Yx(FWY)xxD motif